jgi:hypothetical protein
MVAAGGNDEGPMRGRKSVASCCRMAHLLTDVSGYHLIQVARSGHMHYFFGIPPNNGRRRERMENPVPTIRLMKLGVFRELGLALEGRRAACR